MRTTNMLRNNRIIIIFSAILSSALAGCFGAGSDGGTVNNNATSRVYTLGSLPDGAVVVASSNNLATDVSQAGKVMGTVSIYGGINPNNQYTLTLNELDSNGNLFIDSATQLQPNNCTISSGGSCNIIYPGFSSSTLRKKIKVLVRINNQTQQVALSNTINVNISTLKSTPAITAMAYDTNGNLYSGDSLGNVQFSTSTTSINWKNMIQNANSSIVNLTANNTYGGVYITSRNDQNNTINSISCLKANSNSYSCNNLSLPLNESGTYFYAITTDSNNNVYAGGWNSTGGAIYKLSSDSSQWKNIYSVPAVQDNPRGSYVTAITVDNTNGLLYFGTFAGAVYRGNLITIESPTLLPPIPAAANSRITGLTAGVYSDTPLIVATYNDNLLALIGSPGSFSWNPVLSPSTTPSLNDFIQDMYLVKDNIYPSAMECSILFFIQPSSQQLWHTEICGAGNQNYSPNLENVKFDQNNMTPGASPTQFVIASNDYIYAGATDGSISTKVTQPPIFATFSLVAEKDDGSYYECPGQIINNNDLIVEIDSDVPFAEKNDSGVYSMSAAITSLAPIFSTFGGIDGYVSVAGTLQGLFNDKNLDPAFVTANYYCTGDCEGIHNQPFTYISRFGNLTSTYTISTIPTPNGLNNCTYFD